MSGHNTRMMGRFQGIEQHRQSRRGWSSRFQSIGPIQPAHFPMTISVEWAVYTQQDDDIRRRKSSCPTATKALWQRHPTHMPAAGVVSLLVVQCIACRLMAAHFVC